jgi:hypothetical protein
MMFASSRVDHVYLIYLELTHYLTTASPSGDWD